MNEGFVEDVMARLTAAAGAGLADVLEDVADDVRGSFTTGDGPSQPGEAPRDRSGNLAASVGAAVGPGPGPDQLTGRVTCGHPAAAFLEDGTKDMEPRPFMRPAFERWAPRVPDRLADAMRGRI